MFLYVLDILIRKIDLTPTAPLSPVNFTVNSGGGSCVLCFCGAFWLLAMELPTCLVLFCVLFMSVWYCSMSCLCLFGTVLCLVYVCLVLFYVLIMSLVGPVLHCDSLIKVVRGGLGGRGEGVVGEGRGGGRRGSGETPKFP